MWEIGTTGGAVVSMALRLSRIGYPAIMREDLRCEPGVVFADRFEIQHLAGGGASGAVYRARDVGTGQAVALKLLVSEDALVKERFLRESRVLSALRHPGVVRHVASGTADGGVPYLAMEWLDGQDLRQRLSAGPMTTDESMRLALRVADALAVVHARGFVH